MVGPHLGETTGTLGFAHGNFHDPNRNGIPAGELSIRPDAGPAKPTI